MPAASPYVAETADDEFLRLGSQPFFRTALQNAQGATPAQPSGAKGDLADDLFLRLGTQTAFRTVLRSSSTTAPSGSGAASADLSNADRSLNPLI